MHKAETRHVEAKKLLSRRRQSEPESEHSLSKQQLIYSRVGHIFGGGGWAYRELEFDLQFT